MLRNRLQTSVGLKTHFIRFGGGNLSAQTVRRRLAEANLKPLRPANGPKLERGHRIARQRYVREHLNWTLDDWSRKTRERFHQACVEEKVAYGGGSVQVWAGISTEARTELVLIQNGTLNAERYAEEILNEHVGPFMARMDRHGILMHDNARPHTARIVHDYLEEVGIELMQWPARSPDLNPIEHAWDELQRCVKGRNPPLITLPELKQAWWNGKVFLSTGSEIWCTACLIAWKLSEELVEAIKSIK
ncbi:unnamed protein product [Arctia plantaginis]|uniref:Tc1-like transposase DDE domain-containing protein n=1 Tax=Arctia plantaginis TaxID=874455 RepID=A0A8S0ZAJ5_ARCPL|nr:unnamed protein product [Arctia plantaginis]